MINLNVQPFVGNIREEIRPTSTTNEVDFGFNWYLNGTMDYAWRVSWNPLTGYLYANNAKNQVVILGKYENIDLASKAIGNWWKPEVPYYHNLTKLVEHIQAGGS